jgi:hypothetical protein
MRCISMIFQGVVGGAVGGNAGLLVTWSVFTSWWTVLDDEPLMTVVAILYVGVLGTVFGGMTGLVFSVIELFLPWGKKSTPRKDADWAEE